MLKSALESQGQGGARAPGGEPKTFQESVIQLIKEYNGRDPTAAKAVLTFKIMVGVIRLSTATTVMELARDLRTAAEIVQAEDNSISVKAACELFLCFVTRTQSLELKNFSQVKERLLERGDKFAQVSVSARQAIAEAGQQYISNGDVILTHGYSRCVKEVLEAAVRAGKSFKLVTTLGHPVLDSSVADGVRMAQDISDLGIDVQLVADTGAGYHIERANMVIVGAEGVVENGGIINKAGTLVLAAAAQAYNKPFYVAAESYKFARMYPLTQYDPELPTKVARLGYGPSFKALTVDDRTPLRDYTPPKFVSYLWTDLGVLTTAAVSDELIKLYS